MATNITISELKNMLGIQNQAQWRQIWGDATAIYDAGINSLEFSVQSWAKLTKIFQDAMIVKVITFVINIDN